MMLYTNKFVYFKFLLIFLAAIVYILSITKYGLGLSYDSIAYWAAAESLYLYGNLYLPFTNDYFSDWPPLFSYLLSTGYFFHIKDVLIYYGFLNVLSYFFVLLIFSNLVYRLSASHKISFFFTFLLIVSPPFFLTFSYLWSEPLYILLTLLLISNLYKYITTTSQSIFILCILIAALSVLTRYIGIVNIALGGIILIIFAQGNMSFRIRRSILFMTLSSIPLLFWLMRNQFLSSTLTGSGRTVELSNVKYMILMLVKACWEWFLPFPNFKLGGIIVMIICFVLILAILYLIVINKNRFIEMKVILSVVLIHTILYLMILLITASLQSSDIPNYRLTAPAYITFLLLLSFIAKIYIINNNKLFISSLMVIFCLIAGRNAYYYITYINKTLDQGIPGYSDKSSINSDLIQAARELEVCLKDTYVTDIFSNYAEKLYFNKLYGIYRITGGPKSGISENFKRNTDLKVLIWFGENQMLYNLLNLHLPNYQIIKVCTYNDGFIIYLERNNLVVTLPK